MSLNVDGDLGQTTTPPSWEELGHKMYSKEHVKFHTQIERPDAMSTLDTLAAFAEESISPGVGKIIKRYAANYRDNMVAFKRQRAKETESMVKANTENERQKAGIKELMLGMQR